MVWVEKQEDMEQMKRGEGVGDVESGRGTPNSQVITPVSTFTQTSERKILLQPQNKPITKGAAAAVKLLEYLRSVLTTLSPAVLKQDTECQRGADMLFCSAAPDL